MKEEIQIMRACRQRCRMNDKKLLEFHAAVVKMAATEPQWRQKAQELISEQLLPEIRRRGLCIQTSRH